MFTSRITCITKALLYDMHLKKFFISLFALNWCSSGWRRRSLKPSGNFCLFLYVNIPQMDSCMMIRYIFVYMFYLLPATSPLEHKENVGFGSVAQPVFIPHAKMSDFFPTYLTLIVIFLISHTISL